jgi:hypothetical protein
VFVIGSVFYSALGAGLDINAYSRAFTIAMGCNVGLLVIGGLLSLWLPGNPPAEAALQRPPARLD